VTVVSPETPTPKSALVPEQLAVFLGALYPTTCEGFIELRMLPSGKQSFATADDHAGVANVLRQHATENCYLGVALRRETTSGALANCGELHTLWVDIDFKDVDESVVRTRISSFPIPPHVVVQSGGGLHCYWRLRQPFELPDEAMSVTRSLRRLALHFNGDLAATDPARILRVPGSLNFKYEPPRAVVLDRIDDGAIEAAELDDWLPPEPIAAGGDDGADVPFTVPARIRDGARNVTLYRFGRAIHAKGGSAAAILAALRAENAERCEPPLDDEEVRGLAAHAAAQRDRDDFDPSTGPAVSVGTNIDSYIEVTASALVARTHEAVPTPMLIEGLVPAEGIRCSTHSRAR
jgi:hypothetical protein